MQNVAPPVRKFLHMWWRKILLFAILLGGGYKLHEETLQVAIVIAKDTGATISLQNGEKKALEAFFRRYLFLEQWAYTFFGKKPLSFAQAPSPPPFWDHFSDAYLVWKGWKIWNRISPSLPKGHLHFFEEMSNVPLLGIVDIPMFNAVVTKYRDDFVAGGCTLDTLTLSILENAKHVPLLQGILRDHDALLGIALGYGRDNSWKFFWRNQGNPYTLSPLWEQEEMDKILTKWQEHPATSSWDISHLFYPLFGADTSTEESAALRLHYQQSREEILLYFAQGDFLERTLERYFLIDEIRD